MQSQLQRDLDRITKLRRLSRSTNKHEAKAALRQMKKLMDKAGVLYVADNDTVFLRLDESAPAALVEPYLMQLAYVCATRWDCWAKRGIEGHLAVQGRRVSAEVAQADYRDLAAELAKRCKRGSASTLATLGYADDETLKAFGELYAVRFYSEAVQGLTLRLLPKPTSTRVPQRERGASTATAPPSESASAPLAKPHAKITEAIGKDEAIMHKLTGTPYAEAAHQLWRMAEGDAQDAADTLVRRARKRKAPPAYVQNPLRKVPLGLPAKGQSTIPVPEPLRPDHVRDRIRFLEVD